MHQDQYVNINPFTPTDRFSLFPKMNGRVQLSYSVLKGLIRITDQILPLRKEHGNMVMSLTFQYEFDLSI